MRRASFALRLRRYSTEARTSLETDVVSWLDQRRPREKYVTAVNVGFTQFGRALLASRSIAAGERMLEVPRRLIITREVLPQETAKLLETDNAKTWLSVFLLTEKLKGLHSAWLPYLQCLPAPGELQSTVFWKDEELAWLEHSSAYHETLERRKVIQCEFAQLQNVLSGFSLVDFTHAYSTVTSRSWENNDGVSKTPSASMIPVADFLNHDHRCFSLLSFDKEMDCAVAVADRDYAAGEEVFLCYGYSPNAELAIDYGFALPYNPHEQAKLWLEIPRTDPLREVKLDVLSRHQMRTEVNEDGTYSGGRSFALRELKPLSDYGLPDPLCAFARVICASSVEDLEEMVSVSIEQNTCYGCCRRVDEAKETQAMAFVRDRVQHQLELHTAALETLLQEEAPQSTSSVRRRIAANTLRGELRVLQSVKDHLSEKEFYTEWTSSAERGGGFAS